MWNKLILYAALIAAAPAAAQTVHSPLDPTRNLPPQPAQAHVRLPEEYIWTANDVTSLRADHNNFPWNRPELRTAPHLFRTHFRVASIPTDATVYIAGPRQARVFLNGQLLGEFSSSVDAPINFRVFHAPAAKAL